MMAKPGYCGPVHDCGGVIVESGVTRPPQTELEAKMFVTHLQCSECGEKAEMRWERATLPACRLRDGSVAPAKDYWRRRLVEVEGSP